MIEGSCTEGRSKSRSFIGRDLAIEATEGRLRNASAWPTTIAQLSTGPSKTRPG